MKYFIPEWDDRVDPNYNFITDEHSEQHKKDPYGDHYMWEIFGLNNVPFDGVLVSRVKIEENKNKKKRIQELGIHKFLRLPEDFAIIGDCGAFGYVDEKLPLYDPVDILEYYRDVGFNIGVTVDHLVVPKHKEDKDLRMRTTFENGLKGYEAWSKNFKGDFELLCAVQGWDVKDYLKMTKKYVSHGVQDLAMGGLVRKPTSYIIRLIEELVKELKSRDKKPNRIHFFGLARQALFPYLVRLEDLGVEITFDSASFLRRAWLSAQNNYFTRDGKAYSAIRIPQIGKKTGLRGKKRLKEDTDLRRLKELEQQCLNALRLYDREEIELESVMSYLRQYDKVLGADRFSHLEHFYIETLRDTPWKKCDCPICRNIGVEVIIFRGNNRNRRRGFHNTYLFYQLFKDPAMWQSKKVEMVGVQDLKSFGENEKVLVITGCTKEKLGYDNSITAIAKDMYKGRLFKVTKKFCEKRSYDYVIISAKHGLVIPEETVSGYEKVLRNKRDVVEIQSSVEKRLMRILPRYNKILVIAGKMYRQVLENIWDDRFVFLKSRGYGDLCKKVSAAIEVSDQSLLRFLDGKNRS